MKAFLLPPGKYYIGDPIAVFTPETYSAVLECTSSFLLPCPVVEFSNTNLGVTAQLFGRPTDSGDGEFTDQNGVVYGVNSGALAAIPIELIDNPEGVEHGTVLEIGEPGLVVYFDSDSSTFHFGDITIMTSDDDLEI